MEFTEKFDVRQDLGTGKQVADMSANKWLVVDKRWSSQGRKGSGYYTLLCIYFYRMNPW